MARKSRPMLTGVVAVGAVLTLAGISMFGKGDLYVAHQGQRLEVLIDGKAVKPSSSDKTQLKINAPQGQHQVTLRNADTGVERVLSVDVKTGFSKQVLPLDENQCFARFNVTEYRGTGQPALTGSYQADRAFELPSQTYLSREDMPQKRKKGKSVFLLVAVPCETLRGPPSGLMQAAGFTR